MIHSRIGRRITKELQIIGSKRVDVSSIRSLGIMLGPYRNLSTLLSALLFLHPNCQVLNHAGKRIFSTKRVDFIRNMTPETFEAFQRYAVHISGSGQRGDYGGSITNAHAFDRRYTLWQLFQESNLPFIKNDIHALFWKESMRTTNHMREHDVSLQDLVHAFPKIKFILPIRHPLDCAASNIKTSHYRHLSNVSTPPSVEAVADAILDEYVWTLEQAAAIPDHLLVLFANELDRQRFIDLAKFLHMEPDLAWLDRVDRALDLNRNYQHPEARVQHYRASVRDKFPHFPDFAQRLLAFEPEH